MFNIKKADYIFWAFIFLIILLQLSTSEELTFIVAFTYSVAMILTIRLHAIYVRAYLIDGYLKNNNSIKFIFYTLCVSSITALILTAEGYFIIRLFLPDYAASKLLKELTSMYFGALMFSILISGLSYSIELFKQHIDSERRIQELRNNVLEMEIDHLRNQLTPHFTFNILNNLQFLILKEQQEALKYLARYSQILHYYVYKSQSKLIRLDDEISFLKDYFQLETDRSEADIKTSCELDIKPNQLLVIPFLLSTFIENAFKHVSQSARKDNFIHLSIFLHNESQLNLIVENSFDNELYDQKEEGVGLSYAKKRLELSYKNRYSLTLKNEIEKYSVQLKLELSDS